MNQNAIELLKSDHDKVKHLLSELVETTSRAKKKRQELLSKIATELKIHTQIENEIFYPAFKKAGKRDDQPIFYEAKEEHRAVELLVLPDLEKTDPESEEFSGRAKVLKELVEHHADEEESDMFPRVKELMDHNQLMELGKLMQERKESLASEMRH
mgnify:CR=1 FL=1